jgi:hypothetical protein
MDIPTPPTSVDEFFAGSPLGRDLFTAVARAVEAIGPATIRVTKSQVAFRRRRGFAWVWRPGRYVRSDVPAVLSIALPEPVASARFKEIVNPSPRVWMHHLELRSTAEVDDEVRGWLGQAWAAAV